MHLIEQIGNKTKLNFHHPIKYFKSGKNFFLIVNQSCELFIHGKPIHLVKVDEFFDVPGMELEFVKINEIKNIKLMECGYNFVVSVNELNEIFIFGKIEINQQDLVPIENSNIFKVTNNLQNNLKGNTFKKIACGFDSIFLVTDDNILFVIGVNDFAQLGFISSQRVVSSFTKVDTLQKVNIIDIKCGDDHTLILDDLGQVYGSGSNSKNALGFTDKTMSEFTKLEISFKVKKISCLAQGSILLSFDNDLYITGNMLEQNSDTIFTKVAIPFNNTIDIIYSSYVLSSAYFITTDRKCYVWGCSYEENFNLLEEVNKNYRYITFICDSKDTIVYSDYLINDDELNERKGIKLFKTKLMKCYLQNELIDVTIKF